MLEAYIDLFHQIQQEPLLLRLWQSGRELLHSNMLAYLLESPGYRSSLLGHLWGDDWGDRHADVYHVRALREQNGIDLVVVMLPKSPDPEQVLETEPYWEWLSNPQGGASSARVLIIENKFKSLPDVAQLQGYSEKIHEDQTDVFARKLGWYKKAFALNDDVEHSSHQMPYLVADCRKVILTPTQGNDITVQRPIAYTVRTGLLRRTGLPNGPQGSYQDIWYSRGWQRVAHILPQPDVEAGLEPEFVRSYARLLIASTDLQQLLFLHVNGENSFASLDLLRQYAQPLRLWDFIDKWRYDFLMRKLRDKLRAHGWKPEQLFANHRGNSLQFSIPEAQSTAVVTTFFSRNTGGTDISIFRVANEANFAMIVALQGSTLRLMFALGGNEERVQRAAAQAGLQALASNSEQIAVLLRAAPDQLGTYTQKVGLGVSAVQGDPDVLEVMQQEGRLVYARVSMWTWINGQPAGPWANLSGRCIASRIAAIAVDVLNHWDVVANAIRNEIQR